MSGGLGLTVKKCLYSGLAGRELPVPDETKTAGDVMRQFGVKCVFLSESVMENFYQGFCNKTLWPLFHYFPGMAEYREPFWKQYQQVNELFCAAVLEVYSPAT
jgi:trehalose 6-phosphate synthase/phosphatase